MRLVRIDHNCFINPDHVVRVFLGDGWSELQKKTVPCTHIVLADGKTEVTGLKIEALVEMLQQKESDDNS